MRLSLLLSCGSALALHALLFIGVLPMHRGDASSPGKPRAVHSVRTLPLPLPAPTIAPAPTPAPTVAPPDSAPVSTRIVPIVPMLVPQRVLASKPATPVKDAPPQGDARESAAPEEPIPTYLTRPPPPLIWSYRLRRGALAGQASLSWQPAAGAYEARLIGQFGAASAIDWASRGGFDAAGLAPERFTVQRKGRSVQAANFQRGADIDRPKISYSGPTLEHALPSGAQDRLSWMLQLASIAAAEPERLAEDGQVVMFVSGARGDAARWTFVVLGRERIETALGPADTIRLLRKAQRPYDTRVEVWLDPLRHHLPVRATLANAPNGEALELLLHESP